MLLQSAVCHRSCCRKMLAGSANGRSLKAQSSALRLISQPQRKMLHSVHTATYSCLWLRPYCSCRALQRSICLSVDDCTQLHVGIQLPGCQPPSRCRGMQTAQQQAGERLQLGPGPGPGGRPLHPPGWHRALALGGGAAAAPCCPAQDDCLSFQLWPLSGMCPCLQSAHRAQGHEHSALLLTFPRSPEPCFGSTGGLS